MAMTIYACGGAGINVVKQIKDLDININYIDTSASNLKAVKSENIYLVEDMDGAGKNRVVAYENFKGNAADVLVRFKPSEQLNIVISSLTGGSGAILASLITKELVDQGHNTIVIGLDSDGSLIELSNSVKTLKTYRAISKQISKPIPLYYVNQATRSDADRQALGFITLMALVIDKKRTAEFDNSDLNSFLYFDKTTVNDPSVSVIEVTPNEEIVAEKNTSVVGTIFVTTSKDTTIKPIKPEYLATCLVTDTEYQNEDSRINAVLGKLPLIVSSLEADIKELEDSKRINRVNDVEVLDSNADGIVI